MLERHVLFSRLKRLFNGTSRAEDISVGVEQEFFLCDAASQPASHRQSQRFLRTLKSSHKVSLVEEDDPGIGRYIAFADVNHRGHRIRVKYDHHPHLLELELPPLPNLGQMHELLRFAMRVVSRHATRNGLIAHFGPFLPNRVDPRSVCSEHSLCVALRNYRQRVNADRPDILNNLSLINFSAYIAGTHLHLGGVGWEQLGSLVDALYRMEPDVMPYAWNTVPGFQPTWPNRRWHGYMACLGWLPLVGFPDLSQWTPDQWFDALCDMPLAATTDNHRGGEIDIDDPMGLFNAKRDLCLIKPRDYGTVEFRADPCQPSADAVASICAIRLGVAVEILQGYEPSRSFSDARQKWCSQVSQLVLCLNAQVRDIAASGLRKRGHREELFLQSSGEQSNAPCASC